MLGLKDFVHLPQVDSLFEQIATCEPGLVIVAGLEPRGLSEMFTGPVRGARAPVPPLPASGRGTLFGMLARQMLTAQRGRMLVLSETRDSVRIPRHLRQRVEQILCPLAEPLPQEVERALQRGTSLLLVERLTPETIPLAFHAARRQVRVLSQYDTIFRGREVTAQLNELGASNHDLSALRWVISVLRVPALCPTCRQPTAPDESALAALNRSHPELVRTAAFYIEGSCAECRFTGRQGDVAAFDFFQAHSGAENPFDGESVLPLEDYMLGLAAQGYLELADVARLEARQLHALYRLFAASEHALAHTDSAFKSKISELEAANRVLQKQTEAAISLQELSQALISYSTLGELAASVCRKAGELCGADHAILYLLRADDTAQILAFTGWKSADIQRELKAESVLASGDAAQWTNNDPRPYHGWPPGVKKQDPDLAGVRVRAGLRVPLIAQNEVVGLLIFHSTVKTTWGPREIALLQSFANSSALAIQRAGLVESLREKIEQLEAAQSEIAKKERLERELELARQVQESMLPHIFPLVPGVRFDARSRPARQVGGDFYDVFPLDAGRVGLVVADVSDKGLPAALFMALTRSLILAEARRELSPYVVLQRVHRLLAELSQSDQFVTVFYGVLDPSNHTLTYVRAGHERPFLLRASRTIELGGRGVVVGAPGTELLPLSEEHLLLESGDRLVLFTDGLTDALSPENRPFGLDRLRQLLSGFAAAPLDELCDATFAAIEQHQGTEEQYDDMTLLAVEVNW